MNIDFLNDWPQTSEHSIVDLLWNTSTACCIITGKIHFLSHQQLRKIILNQTLAPVTDILLWIDEKPSYIPRRSLMLHYVWYQKKRTSTNPRCWKVCDYSRLCWNNDKTIQAVYPRISKINRRIQSVCLSYLWIWIHDHADLRWRFWHHGHKLFHSVFSRCDVHCYWIVK